MRRWRRRRTVGSASRRWSASPLGRPGRLTVVAETWERVVRAGDAGGGTLVVAGRWTLAVVGRGTLVVGLTPVGSTSAPSTRRTGGGATTGTASAPGPVGTCRGRRRRRGRRTASRTRTTTPSNPGWWHASGTRCDGPRGRGGRARGDAARGRRSRDAGGSRARRRLGRGRRRGPASSGGRGDGGRAARVASRGGAVAPRGDRRGRARRRGPRVDAFGPLPARVGASWWSTTPGRGPHGRRGRRRPWRQR